MPTLNLTATYFIYAGSGGNEFTFNVNLDLSDYDAGSFVGTYTNTLTGITLPLTYPNTYIGVFTSIGEITYNIVNGDYRYVCSTQGEVDTEVLEETTVTEVCNTDGIYLRGCTDPLATNYNENAIYDDGSCEYGMTVVGCTNPLALNYNPLATNDDGSCIFGEVADVIRGCTNPLALNYNPMANLNDGSCIFVSGCTISNATNYDVNAVIDDGSCVCNSYEIGFNIGDEEFIDLNLISFTDCIVSVSLSLGVRVECGSILEQILAQDYSLNYKLASLQIYLASFDEQGDLIEKISIWKFTNNISHYGSEEDCALLEELFSFENSITCQEGVASYFEDKKVNVERILTNVKYVQPFKFGLVVDGFDFDHNIIIDNIEINVVCTERVDKCVLIPSNYGFELERIEAEKVTLNPDKEIFNTKEVTLRVSPLKHINDSVIDYFNKYGYYGQRDRLYKLDETEVTFDLINVRSRKTDDEYYHLNDVYDLYLNNQGSCSFENAQLEYDYLNFSYDNMPTYWRQFLDGYLDPTIIRPKSDYYYANNLFHVSKFPYRKYTMDRGCDGEAVLDIEIVSDDVCVKNRSYKSRFEFIRDVNGFCVPCENSGVTYSYFDDGVSESGRMVQYTGDTFTGVTETINFETYLFSDCNIICEPVNIEFTNIDTTIKNTIIIDFVTTGVNDISEIDVYYNGIIQFGYLTFDVETGIGQYFFDENFDFSTVEIFVSNDCGSDSDIAENLSP